MGEWVLARSYALTLLKWQPLSEQSNRLEQLSALKPHISQLQDKIPVTLGVQVAEERLTQIDLPIDDILKRLLVILSQSGQLKLLPKITDIYCLLYFQAMNYTEVSVTSAAHLNETQQQHVYEMLQASGFEVDKSVIHFHVDTSILGGSKVTIDGMTIDDTLICKLNHLEHIVKQAIA